MSDYFEIEWLRQCELQDRIEELQARIEALEGVVNGGKYDDPYAMWDRACKYKTAATKQEGEG